MNLLQDLLEPDYDIVAAKNGESALKRALATPPPDLILLDVMMPGMDGFQVLEQLQATPHTQSIPVLFVTAMNDAPNEAQGLAMGAVDYIGKPFSPAVVRARVQTHLRLKESMEKEQRMNQQLGQLNALLSENNQKLQELNKKLLDMASVDGLTDIPNRRRFDAFLAHEWSRAVRDKTPLALILLDIDFFKPFNDHYGHAAGDECLKKVAKALAAAMLRSIDLVARYGGEEFVCVLPGTDTAGMIQVGNRLRESVAALALPHAYSAVASHITISLGGVSLIPDAASEANILVPMADERLYKAKAAGRNRLVTE
ncbi:MAG: diguanylate cyclase [Magnetococcales bacterium]|nr:diguanylate cyclase [Magnetococcales bacterium]